MSASADLARVLHVLGSVLADELVLASQTRLYSWNVVGPQQPSLRPLFGRQHRQLERAIDAIAERVRQLGGVPASLSGVVSNARLRERPAPQPPARDMIAFLFDDHQALLAHLREDGAACGEQFHDRVTMLFLLDLQARHEKMARDLRALLEAPVSEAPA